MHTNDPAVFGYAGQATGLVMFSLLPRGPHPPFLLSHNQKRDGAWLRPVFGFPYSAGSPSKVITDTSKAVRSSVWSPRTLV